MKLQNVLESLELSVQCDQGVENSVIWFLEEYSDWSVGIWGGQILPIFPSRQELVNYVESEEGSIEIQKYVRETFDIETAEEIINDLLEGWE